jgi:Na+-driven multidrug efflux pump
MRRMQEPHARLSLAGQARAAMHHYTFCMPPAAALPSPADRLTQGPVLPVMLSLALPNMVAMVSAAAVSIAETAYVGALGRDALAAMAVVFPFVMLMQTVSGGAMGGAISAAVSRALGANRDDAARSLALHAAVIGLAGGLIFLAVFLLFGPALYHLLGARDAVLQQALLYSNVLFVGAPLTWLNNSLVSVVRGSGNIRFSALLIVGATLVQVVLGAGMGLGLGPFPRWGMAGARRCRACSCRGAARHCAANRSRRSCAWGCSHRCRRCKTC